ncbi:hypothetical protein [Micromonospora sp. WMMD1274]|uniref:hypothetical protein n=1 Tax=Micromonospora sp. WMMD1274 TaxID=3404116 RepID=UPI003B92F8E6
MNSLIAYANAVLNPRMAPGYGGTTLVIAAGSLSSGVCIATGSGAEFLHRARNDRCHGLGWGNTIIAVWRNEKGVVCVLPACGCCRRFIRRSRPR